MRDVREARRPEGPALSTPQRDPDHRRLRSRPRPPGQPAVPLGRLERFWRPRPPPTRPPGEPGAPESGADRRDRPRRFGRGRGLAARQPSTCPETRITDARSLSPTQPPQAPPAPREPHGDHRCVRRAPGKDQGPEPTRDLTGTEALRVLPSSGSGPACQVAWSSADLTRLERRIGVEWNFQDDFIQPILDAVGRLRTAMDRRGKAGREK